eukprot:1194329-Prorocentrum_minimum.AAC.4
MLQSHFSGCTPVPTMARGQAHLASLKKSLCSIASQSPQKTRRSHPHTHFCNYTRPRTHPPLYVHTQTHTRTHSPVVWSEDTRRAFGQPSAAAAASARARRGDF